MKEFPNTAYSTWTEEEQTALKWLHAVGVEIEWFFPAADGWMPDASFNPDKHSHLRYRIKP